AGGEGRSRVAPSPDGATRYPRHADARRLASRVGRAAASHSDGVRRARGAQSNDATGLGRTEPHRTHGTPTHAGSPRAPDALRLRTPTACTGLAAPGPMTTRRYVLALDQGTTGSTALVVDADGGLPAPGYSELPQHFRTR